MVARVNHHVICFGQHITDVHFAVILVQAENEFTAGAGRSDYMQAVIDNLRANGVVVRTSRPIP